MCIGFVLFLNLKRGEIKHNQVFGLISSHSTLFCFVRLFLFIYFYLRRIHRKVWKQKKKCILVLVARLRETSRNNVVLFIQCVKNINCPLLLFIVVGRYKLTAVKCSSIRSSSRRDLFELIIQRLKLPSWPRKIGQCTSLNCNAHC